MDEGNYPYRVDSSREPILCTRKIARGTNGTKHGTNNIIFFYFLSYDIFFVHSGCNKNYKFIKFKSKQLQKLMFHQSEQYYYDTVGASPLEQEQGHGNPGGTRSSQQHYYCKNSNNIETTTTKNDKSSSSSNREDWHDIFVDLTYPMSSLKSDPVHCK